MKYPKHFVVDILFVLTLFGVFTLSALMLVTIGAEVYRHTVQDMSENYETRTSISYITEKIRQNDTLSEDTGICITYLSGTPALTLTQRIDGELYNTYLYYHDGFLKELFTKSEHYLGDNVLAAGHNIMQLNAFLPVQTADNLFSIQIITPQGSEQTFFVSTHCNAR